MSRTEADLPNIFEYLDHRRWLKDWFEAKCTANPRYSHRVFARAAGVSNPSLLHLVAKGDRNVTATTLPGFCKALGLRGEARKHFERLVAMERAKSPAQRASIFETIRATKHFREANQLASGGLDYLSDWTLPAIRELVACDGFVDDPEWIAATLRPRISARHAARSLDTLERTGLIERTADGVRATDAAVITPHEAHGVAVYGFHNVMMERAREALESVPPAERHFGAVTVRVDDEGLSLLKAEVAAFQERLLALCDNRPTADRVMQVNVQLFPLSRSSCDS